MRFLYGTILVALAAALALGGHPDSATDTEYLTKTARFVLKGMNLDRAKEDQAVLALVASAQQDPTLERSLLFTANGMALAASSQKAGNLFKRLGESNSETAWHVLTEMGRNYRSQGELSAVRYETGNRANWWISDFADRYRTNVSVQMLNDRYANLRQHGFRPDEVYDFLMDKGWSPEVKSGITEIYSQMRDLGEAFLTGYSDSQAQRDVAAYLEAHYAAVYPEARDIGSVQKAVRPMDYMAIRVLAAMKSDISRMRKPLDSAIEKALAGGGTTMPSEPRSGPFKLPDLKSIGMPGSTIHRDGYVWNSSTSNSHGYGPFRFEAARPDQRTFVSKYLAEGSPTFARGFSIACYNAFKDGDTTYGISLKPNRIYEVVLYPWYSSEQDGAAYFVGGDPVKDHSYNLEHVPSQGRAYLPARQGGLVEVRIQVRTDGGGHFCIICMQPGPGAISVGRIFLQEIK